MELRPAMAPQPPTMQDVSPPASLAMPPQPAPSLPAAPPQATVAPSNPIVSSQTDAPQVVDNIPLKQPGIAGPSIQSPSPGGSQPAGAKTEDELDKILQAVNNRVATSAPNKTEKKFQLGQKLVQKTKLKKKTGSAKPIGPTAIVVTVALMLAATAVFAYRESNNSASAAKVPGKVGTSYTASGAIQQAGGSLVQPGDLDSFAQTLQTKLNSLNDGQDFDAHSLSSQSLGI